MLSVLQKYMHLFAESVDNIGCSSNIRHKVEMGDNPPVRKNPYRLPYALKPVVDEQIRDMIKKIICPSNSPW